MVEKKITMKIMSYRFRVLLAIIFFLFSIAVVINSKGVVFFDSLEISLQPFESSGPYQVFYNIGNGYNEKDSSFQQVDNKNQRALIKFSLPKKLIEGIRIDPGNQIGFYKINRISLLNNNKTLLTWLPDNILKDFKPLHDIGVFEKKNDALLLETTGEDPYFSSIKDISKLYMRVPRFEGFLKLIIFFVVLILSVAIICFDKVLSITSRCTFWIKNYQHRGLITTISLITAITVVVYWKFVSLQQLYIYRDIGVDTYYVFWPNFVHLSNYIFSEGLPQWTFNVGLGQNTFLPGDPFSLLSIVFGPKNVAYTLGYSQSLKVILSGLFFFLYLRLISIENFSSIIGAVLYAFCGHNIVRGGWYHYSTEVVLTAFLLFSFEMYYKKSKPEFLPIGLAFLIAARSSFYLYLYTILFFAYSFFRFLCENKFKIKKIFFYYLGLFKLYVLGVLISSFFFLPNAYDLMKSPRVSGESSNFFLNIKAKIFTFNGFSEYLTSFFRLISSDIMGTGSLHRGWCNYLEDPVYYCGIVVLLLIPQLFKFLSVRKKILYACLIIFVFLYVIFPYSRYILNGFSGGYYKTSSFWISIVMIFIAVQAIDFIRKKNFINIKLLYITLFFWSLLLLSLGLYFNKIDSVGLDRKIFIEAFILLGAYAIVLTCFIKKNLKKCASIALLILVSFEAGLFSYNTVNNRNSLPSEYLTSKNGYMDYSNEAIAYINSLDRDFFRIEKNYNSVFLDDALFQNYYGTKSYRSFNSSSYVNFLDKLEVPLFGNMKSTGWIGGFKERILLNDLVGVRYYLSKNELSYYGCKYLRTFGDVNVYKNERSLPLGFLYDTYITYDDFMILSYKQRDEILLKAFVLENGQKTPTEYKRLKKKEVVESRFAASEKNGSISKQSSPPYEEFDYDIDNLKKDILLITHHGQNKIEGKINSSSNKLLFLSIPYDRGWTLKIDGVKVELLKINIGFMGANINEGNHEIELIYRSPWMRTGMVLSLIGLVLFVFLIIRDVYKKSVNDLTKNRNLKPVDYF